MFSLFRNVGLTPKSLGDPGPVGTYTKRMSGSRNVGADSMRTSVACSTYLTHLEARNGGGEREAARNGGRSGNLLDIPLHRTGLALDVVSLGGKMSCFKE